MKNAEIINVLVAELLNNNSEFEQDINETVSNLSEEAAESVALIAYLNGTNSELENECRAELDKAIENLPTEQRFELDELVALIAYTRA